MKQNNVWGDNIIICAFSDKYNVNIEVVDGTDKGYISQCPIIENGKKIYLGLVSLSGGNIGNHFVGIGQVFNQSGGQLPPAESKSSGKTSRLIKNLAIKAYLGYDIEKEKEKIINEKINEEKTIKLWKNIDNYIKRYKL